MKRRSWESVRTSENLLRQRRAPGESPLLIQVDRVSTKRLADCRGSKLKCPNVKIQHLVDQ